MSTANGEHPVLVNVGPCRCSGGADAIHPDGDTVELAARPSLRLGLAANAAIGQSDDAIGLQALLGSVFVRYGVVGWNIVDEKRQPVPVTPDAVEARLSWDQGGREVADRASDLYTDAIIAPLLQKLSTSQEPGPTAASTSPSPPSPWQPPSSSGESSPENSEPGTPSSATTDSPAWSSRS